jgi:hypothetical protein
MLDGRQGLRSASPELSSRYQIALDRVQRLIVDADEHASRTSRNYFALQCLTIGLAAITPCLIVLSKENPGNPVLNWFQLFFPAIAAISAGLSHVFHWREDAVRYTSLAESIRSQLWRFQTRSGEFGGGLTDEQAIDRLVVGVDELNLQTVARWSRAQLADGPTRSSGSPRATANAGEPSA